MALLEAPAPAGYVTLPSLSKELSRLPSTPLRRAWFYYGEARELLVPVPFMATATTDKLYDEMQTVKPADLPPVDLVVGAKIYKLTGPVLVSQTLKEARKTINARIDLIRNHLKKV